jgi:hypothetical protein
MLRNEWTMQELFEMAAHGGGKEQETMREMAGQFEEAAVARVEAIQAVLWNDRDALWEDFVLSTGRHLSGSERFYASTFFPVWANLTRMLPNKEGQEIEERFLAKLLQLNVLDYIGGLPTSRLVLLRFCSFCSFCFLAPLVEPFQPLTRRHRRRASNGTSRTDGRRSCPWPSPPSRQCGMKPLTRGRVRSRTAGSRTTTTAGSRSR